MGPSGGRGVSWEQLPWLRLLGLSARLPGGPGKGGGRQTRACCGPGGAHEGVPHHAGSWRGPEASRGAHDTEA